MKSRSHSCILCLVSILIGLYSCGRPEALPKTVVLTFDDAVKSHRTFVAPLLQEYGFGATFFVTHRWMDDTANFMNWEEIGELHRMGFEIGNHSWSHIDFASPVAAARLEGELGLVNLHLGWQDVPPPLSFAWCGNGFGPEALARLKALGYGFARRGMQPEVEYGTMELGPVYEPEVHNRLLIPTAGDAYPEWTLDHFKKVVGRADEGLYPVIQFHGVPDVAHPWVHTDPKLFEDCMQYLAENDFQVIALRDLDSLMPEVPPLDLLVGQRYTPNKNLPLQPPIEVRATQKNLTFWLANMLKDHQYTSDEAQQVSGLEASRWPDPRTLDLSGRINSPGVLKVLPYPGGRHPRIGFLDGAMDPLRGTKLSVFLPWDTTQYVVVDLPEAIFSQNGLEFLAHTHVPTIYDYAHQTIENVDWVTDGSSWINSWEMPNKLKFGAKATPDATGVDVELWLENATGQDLDSLITQVCVMFRGARDFNQLTNDNKMMEEGFVATESVDGDHWILTAWENPHRVWGNDDVPCMHVDPRFPPCKAGETVTLTGRLWFTSGELEGPGE